VSALARTNTRLGEVLSGERRPQHLDLARTAICSLLSRGDQENALASAVNQNVARVKELQQEIEMLRAEIALFKANSAERKGNKSGEAIGDAGSPEPDSQLRKAIPDPEL